MAWTLSRRTLAKGLGAALVCCVAGTIALHFFGVRGTGATTRELAPWPFLDMWVRWDAGWYQGISTWGYAYSPTEQSAVAYFPLYPMLMRGLVVLGMNPFIAGMLLTFLFGIVALQLFAAWCARVTDAATADRATWIVVLWPFAYYLYGAVYTDALFLALAVGAFLQLEDGRLGRATLLGALATATRPVGLAVTVGLLARQFELRRRAGEKLRARDLLPVLTVAGLGAYMTYLWIRFGDPLAFVRTQAGWNQAPGAEWAGKFTIWKKWIESPHPEDILLPILHTALALGCVALGVPMWRRLGKGYAIYVWAVLALPLLASRDYTSLGRYAIAAFPSFLMLALLLGPRRRAFWGWLSASAAVLVLMVAKFAMGRYVA